MKKQFKKVIGVGVGLSLLFTAACGSEDKQAEYDGQQVEQVEQVSIESVEVEQADIERQILEQTILTALEEIHKETGTVESDEYSKTFLISITDDSFLSVVSQYAFKGLKVDVWKRFEQSTVDLSRVISKDIGKNYTIKLVNGYVPTKTILEVKDGVVITEPYDL